MSKAGATVRSLPAPEPSLLRKDPDGLATALSQLGIAWRWNIRAARPEFSFSLEGHDWQPATDLLMDRLRMDVAQRFNTAGDDGTTARFYFGRELWTACLNGLLFDNQVDPFRQWLESLEPWDGTKRLDHWLTWCFTLEDPQCPLTRWASAALFLGCVARTFQPGYKADEMVVLHGPQGCGKSTALRAMFPGDHPEWFGDGLHMAADSKTRTEALLGRVLVEASELAGSNRAELESLKAFLSRTDDGGIRLAYRRNPEHSLPRRCIIAGTMNHDGLPNDPTGNRRFVVVKVKPGEYSDQKGAAGVWTYLQIYRECLWAEALARYRDGEPAWLPAHLSALQARVNEEFRRGDDIIENGLTDWLDRQTAPFTIAAAAAGLGLVQSGQEAKLSRGDEMRISAALVKAGCEKRRVRTKTGQKRLWTVPTCANLE